MGLEVLVFSGLELAAWVTTVLLINSKYTGPRKQAFWNILAGFSIMAFISAATFLGMLVFGPGFGLPEPVEYGARTVAVILLAFGMISAYQ